MVKVSFGDRQSFKEELEKQGILDSNVVRVTLVLSYKSNFPHLQELTLVATALTAHLAPGNIQILRLDEGLGTILAGTEAGKADALQMNKIAEKFKDDLRGMGFDVRRGVFESAKEGGK